MFVMNDSFVDYLKSHANSRVYLKPYWGNSGDHLIWLGNELLLEELGITRCADPSKADIILWPGGNPTMWASNIDAWCDCWKRWPVSEFVVAPATFQGNEHRWRYLLKNAPGNVRGAFCRDRESYQNLREVGLRSDIETGLGHDPAFHLKDSAWIKSKCEANTSEYVLASFRNDHESEFVAPRRRPFIRRLLQIWPLSSLERRLQGRRHERFHQRRMELVKKISGANENILEQDASLMSFELFVECVQRASEVHTDRLHCMILALLLGKEVFAYPTGYSKLEGVYEHSVKSWASVRFVREGGGA